LLAPNDTIFGVVFTRDILAESMGLASSNEHVQGQQTVSVLRTLRTKDPHSCSGCRASIAHLHCLKTFFGHAHQIISEAMVSL